MKEIISFTLRKKNARVRGGRGNDLPEDLFAVCADRWPDYIARSALKVEGDPSSPSIVAIVKFLHENGLEANYKRFPAVGYREEGRFQLKGRRVFSQEEVNEASLCVAIPSEEIIDSAMHREDGMIESGKIQTGASAFGRASGSMHCLCTCELMESLLGLGLRGLIFNDTMIGGRSGVYYQISSRYELPPTASPLVDLEGNPSGSESSGCQLDDLYYPPVLTYSKSLVGELPEFDLATTVEHFGSGRRASWESRLVVGQVFRKAAVDLGLAVDYTPVVLS